MRPDVLIVTGFLLGLDAITKYVLKTPDWAYHEQGMGYGLIVLLALGFALVIHLVGLTMASVLIVCGATGNGVSALFGSVPNPFVIQSGDVTMAFNMADLFVVAGAALIVLAVPDMWRRAVNV